MQILAWFRIDGNHHAHRQFVNKLILNNEKLIKTVNYSIQVVIGLQGVAPETAP